MSDDQQTPPTGSPVVDPAPQAASAKERMRFPSLEIPALGVGSPGEAGDLDSGEERWILTIQGKDFGPYTAARVLSQLHEDAIDENTRVFDLFTQDVGALIDMPTFTEAVMDYLPERAKRRLAQEERRQEVVQQAKNTGRTTVMTTVLAVVAGAALLYFTRTETHPLPLEAVVKAFDGEFVVRERTVVEIEADPALIARLFDFSEPLPDPDPAVRRGGRSGNRSANGTGGADDFDDSPEEFVLRLDRDAPSRKLTQDEINGTIAGNQGAIQRCFQTELRQNPQFRGVTISWQIMPDGRTSGIELQELGRTTDDAKNCLRRTFRSMRFPTFNDVPMNVSIPFRLQ